MASKTTRNVLIGGVAVVVVGAGVVFASVSHQPEKVVPEQQNYVPTAADIAHAKQVSRDFYSKRNNKNIQITAEKKAHSIDGEGRIFESKNGIYEIRAVAAEPYIYKLDEAQPGSIYTTSGVEENQSIWNQMIKDGFSQEDFDTTHNMLLGINVSFDDEVVIGPVTTTYNIASGRVCELKAGILKNHKYNQDCYSITELTPGTQLARDVQTINEAHKNRVPDLALDM